jgi:hypothetical protein
LSEVHVGGATFVRVEVPDEGEGFTLDRLYAPAAIFSLTLTTEAELRGAVRRAREEREAREKRDVRFMLSEPEPDAPEVGDADDEDEDDPF